MKLLTAVACSTFAIFLPALRAAPADSESVTLDRATEIPGTTLQAGQFRFEVEDRLQDRAVVRITAQDGATHELVLSVPNDKLAAPASGNVLYFPAGDSAKQTVQAWKCASCPAPLEFVYPKDQAVAVTQATGKAVMAVDPSYDKLPKNLSPDDMKVVTLWLLAPKQITADGKGSGVEPTKYADLKAKEAPVAAAVSQPAAPTAAAAPATPAEPPAAPVQAAAPAETPAAPVQAAQPSATKMPHTASHNFELAVVGIFLLLSSAAVLYSRSNTVDGD